MQRNRNECVESPPSAETVTRASIIEAARRISGWIRRTPVIALEDAFSESGQTVLKLELLQHSGSFKPRGAFNRILASEVPETGVVAASGGNHGIGVAYAARELGHRAEIFVPEFVSPIKLCRLREYGASVHIVGVKYAETLLACERRAAETGALLVHAYDHPDVIAGQGTVGMEFGEQAPDLNTILVAVGGGGLVGGVAAWFRGEVRVIGVEPVRAHSLWSALRAGSPVDVDVGGIAVDSLGAQRVGRFAFAIAQRFVERVVLVEEEAISLAQRKLWEKLRIVAEPGGAAALAALISRAYCPEAKERVGVLVCGGNAEVANFNDTRLARGASVCVAANT